jgi:hypothetical protein
MKILKAKNYLSEIKIPVQLFDVEKLRIIPSYEWLEKKMRLYEYTNSLDKAGMLYPIVVTDHNEQWLKNRILKKNLHHKDENNNLIQGLYVLLGNKRVMWAKENKYDKIEGYFIKDEKDKQFIKNLTNINHKDIPK